MCKLIKAFTIDDKVVKPTGETFLGCDVYSHETDYSEEHYYFVDSKGDVKGSFVVESGMSQGQGFSEVYFKEVK